MLLYTFDTQRYWVDSLYKNEEIYFEEKKLNKSYHYGILPQNN